MTRKALALWMVVAVVGVSLGLVGLRPSSVDATAHSATRSFSAASVLPGEQLVVTIGASEYGGLGEVRETLEGFTYVEGSSTLSGVEVLEDGTLSWILTGEPSFDYTVTVNSEGPYSITGVVYKVLQEAEGPSVIGGTDDGECRCHHNAGRSNSSHRSRPTARGYRGPECQQIFLADDCVPG